MATEETQSERRRTAAKSWASRSAKALMAVMAEPQVTRLALEDAVDDLDRRLAALDDAQSAVELEVGDPQKLDEDIDAADYFRRLVRFPRLKAAKMILDMAKEEHPVVESASSSKSSATESSSSSAVKLPAIELPKFAGDILEWHSFWGQFVALVDESAIQDVGKLAYLQASLEGEAKRTVQDLSLTAANYPTACSLLKERYGRPERAIFAHVAALLKISAPAKTSGPGYVASLWKMQERLASHLRSLEALDVKEERYGAILTPLILSRLPQDIIAAWCREGAGHETEVSWLMKFLQQELEGKERSLKSEGEASCRPEPRRAPAADHLLCRKCGIELTENRLDNYVNATSPLSESTRQLSVLGHSSLIVQKLTNKAGVTFELVTLKRSACSGQGVWYREHTWFPGYLWKVCVCPRCQEHLGWVFEPKEKATDAHFKASTEGFYGLVLENLITETFSDSLLKTLPKPQKF